MEALRASIAVVIGALATVMSVSCGPAKDDASKDARRICTSVYADEGTEKVRSCEVDLDKKWARDKRLDARLTAIRHRLFTVETSAIGTEEYCGVECIKNQLIELGKEEKEYSDTDDLPIFRALESLEMTKYRCDSLKSKAIGEMNARDLQQVGLCQAVNLWE